MAAVDVLVLDDQDSEHADLVEASLSDRGAVVRRLNSSSVASGCVLNVAPGRWRDQSSGEVWEVSLASTIWYRRVGAADVAGLDRDEAQLARDELPHLVLGGLVATGARWVDEPFDVWRAEHKLYQLATANRLEIRTPASLVTNDPAAVSDMLAKRRLVAKPLSPGQGIAPFVAEISETDADLVAALPVFVQELVSEASADLRVVVVGSRGWVWQRERVGGVIDWREADPGGDDFAVVSRDGLVRDAVHLTQALGLTMSVQDWLDGLGGAVFLEANPQGAWAFLRGSEEIVPIALAEHLHPGPSDVVGEGRYPKPLRRIWWDLGPARAAPENDGLEAPGIVPPASISLAARSPDAVSVARRANDEAKAGAKLAEEKASRLSQTALAALAIATAVGGYQLGFVIERDNGLMISLLPVVGAIACLVIAALEAVEVDRVGFYQHPDIGDLASAGARDPIVAVIEREEIGRRLAKWTSDKKHSAVMQARAWFSRGLVLLIAAGLLAAASWGVSLGE